MASNIQPIAQGPTPGAWSDAFTYHYAEAASQTYIIGAPLKFSSGGMAIISSVTAPTIAGIALVKATGVTAADAMVVLPYQAVQFEVSVDTTTTSGTAALGTGKPSDFTIGTNYQLLLDSTSGNYYMGTGTSNAVFQLMGYDPDQKSLVNGRVQVRILTSQTIYS
jgi:hypothetical protein